MYEEQREDRGNNLLGNVVIGAGLLGAGVLGANYARSVAKNRARKAQVNVSDNMPRSGQGGVQRMDLSALPSQTKAGVYQRAKEKYPDIPNEPQMRQTYAADQVRAQQHADKFGYGDLNPSERKLTDPFTGEIFARGRSPEMPAPKNQGGGINLSKQNLMGQGSLTTDQMLSFGQRKSRPDVDYVRGRIAKDLEAGVQLAGPSVQLRNLPPADRVAQLLSEVGVDERGAMTAGREVAQEAAQMAGTESSRQSAAVRRMEKQDPEFERIAKDIIAEMRGGGGQGVAKQPKPSGDGGINDEKAARIARNRQQDVSRVAGMVFDAIDTEISEGYSVPESISKLANRASTGTIDEQDVNTFRNWMQGAYKDDPTVLREMNEELSSVFPQQQSVQPKPRGGGGPKLAGYSEGPVDAADQQNIRAARQQQPKTLVEVRQTSAPFVRDAQNEAIQTANDQSDSKFFKNLQRNEDVDLTIVNEDILDKQKARAFDQLVADAERYTRDKQIASEIDLQYDYSSEEARQAADVGAALERIRNNPKRLAAEGIISELQAEGRAERDLARFQSEGEGAGELPGLKAEDNTRQRSQQQGSRSMTGEQLEEVLLGESKVIDTNMRGRALRGGKVNEEGNMFTEPGTVTYVGEGGAETGDFRDASTGVRTDIDFVASVPTKPGGAASIVESERIRHKYQNQRPEPLRGPAADVARSMQTLREGMSVEPREVRPSTQVPTINKGGYAHGEAVIAVPAETAFTGDAADAAGPVLFTGKNKRDSAVVGTSPPLVQETVVANPQAAAQNESTAQSFLSRAIGGGLTQRGMGVAPVYETADTVPKSFELTPYGKSVEEYKTPRIVGPAEAGPGRVPLSRTAAPSPEMGPDPSQRTGYARYLIADKDRASKPVGTPSTGAITVGINYAELPQSTAYRPSDVGRTLPNLSANPAAVARTMNFADSEAPTRTVYRDTKTGYDYVAHPMQPSQVPEVREPMPIAPDAGPVRKSYLADPNRTYAPQALAGSQASVTYPHMRGEALFPTGTLMNDPNLRGGPVKFEGRERREDEYVRPISERLGRGDTMQRFPLIRRG